MNAGDREGAALNAIERELDEHVAYVLRTATSAPAGGDGSWDAVLHHYNVALVAPEIRRSFAQSSGLARGAVPAEVRRALDTLVTWAMSRVAQTVADPQHPARRAAESRITSLPRERATQYLRAIDPSAAPDPFAATPPAPAVAVSSIFANASATAGLTPWANSQGTSVNSLMCPSCGASQEVALHFTCRYCRAPLGGAQ